MIHIFHNLVKNVYQVNIESENGSLINICPDETSAIDLALVFKPDLILLHISDDDMRSLIIHVCTIYHICDLWYFREELPPTKARVFTSKNFFECLFEARSAGCNLIYIETRGFYETL